MPNLQTRCRGYIASFFQCIPTRELWRHLGLSNTIYEAIVGDRSSSMALESILHGPNKPMIDLPKLGLQKVITMSCWYLWWFRRHATHGGSVPPIIKCMLSILAITKNFSNQVHSWSGLSKLDGLSPAQVW